MPLVHFSPVNRKAQRQPLDLSLIDNRRRFLLSNLRVLRLDTSRLCPKHCSDVVMVKRTERERKNHSPDVLLLLEEVGLAVRECLEQMHNSRDKMKTPIEKDGDEDEGSGILSSE